MKKFIWTYGLIAAIIISAMMIFTTVFIGSLGYDKGEIVGYTTMILAFSMVYFATDAYRKNHGLAKVTFGTSMKIGFYISLIGSGAYVATWMVLYTFVFPDFWDTMGKNLLEQMRNNHRSAADIAHTAAQMAKYKELYKNPLINMGMTFIEIFPVGILVSLISGGIMQLRKAKNNPPE